MPSYLKNLAVGALLAAVSLGLPAVANAAPAGPVDLGTLPGDQFSDVAAINTAGVMVGVSMPRDGRLIYHPVKWDEQGRITALPTLGGEQGEPRAVNDAGVAVGWAWDGVDGVRAVRWAPDGSITALPSPGDAGAADISETGVIIGGGSDGHGGQVSLRWDRNGRSVALAPLPGGGETDATGITADGSLISGIAYDAADHPHAVRWNAAGVVTDLSPGYAEASVSAISDAGVITGTVTETGQARPVVWGRDGRMTPLGWPAPPSYAQPRAINSAGVVVGAGDVEFAQDRAVRWVHGTATVLEADRRSQAVAVNAAGTAVGYVDSVAARWGADGTETSLGILPGGDASRATGIGRNGTIIGMSDTADAWHAVYWPAS
ncbi:hypothetical protein ACIOD2_07505 [Amycolatopsis sp. NPDC088138]|uniref:hypothetical protein n=1 Tax=Amycolatopsis sp. NPDC088138 TaxID=3363938 RepID=UPI0038147129